MQDNPSPSPLRPFAASRHGSNRRTGFSILELLLVLVILAVLAGIVGVRFAGQSGKAKVTAAKSQLSNFKTALGTFEIDATRFPTTQEGLDALLERPSGIDDDEWGGPYMDTDETIKDPWGNDWQYRSPGTENEDTYDLYSFGPDGKEGGDDDITNWSTSN